MSEMVRVGTAPEPGRYGCFEVLSSWLARVCGLLGPPERGRAVLIERCRSIHTFGMRFAIDVALVDEEMDSVTPFYFDNNDDNGSFDMCFVQDGDVAHMATADTDDVIAAVSEVLANIQG